jgi:UDP-glucuronate 4-epimerase
MGQCGRGVRDCVDRDGGPPLGGGRALMRALVTGGAGFIGSHLTAGLLEDGHEAIVVDRLSDYYPPKLKRRNLDAVAAAGDFRFLEADLNDLDLAALLDGVDVVFHHAGQPGVRSSWGEEFGVYVADNVNATQRLLEAARRHGSLNRFVYASSSSIYGDAASFPTKEEATPAPVSPYGVSKLAGEHLARLYHRVYGVPAVTLRYFTIYGPRQRPDMAFARFIEAARAGEPIDVYGDGGQAREFTYVGDCVAATRAAAELGAPGLAYNIAGGSETTVLEVLDILSELLGRPVARRHLDAVPGDARRTGADTTLAARDLGYVPGTSLAEGLRAQLEAAQASAVGA